MMLRKLVGLANCCLTLNDNFRVCVVLNYICVEFGREGNYKFICELCPEVFLGYLVVLVAVKIVCKVRAECIEFFN